jgi:predicted RNA binding protein YcfA (HicA-like mRNA interferase family)
VRVPPPVLSVTARELTAALKRDGFKLVKRSSKGSGSSHQIYRRESDRRRVIVTFHRSGGTFREGTLKRMLVDAGWASFEEDQVYEDALRRVKLLR